MEHQDQMPSMENALEESNDATDEEQNAELSKRQQR